MHQPKMYPPVLGKIAISLGRSKRPEGVTQLEATLGGGGTRLAAQIHRLEKQGHRFRKRWQEANGSRFMRYWWLDWKAPSAAMAVMPPPSPVQPGTYSANL